MDGILIINKPKGLTSHDVVLQVRKKIGQQKVGHAGTLDPIATGILVLAIGKATKFVTRFTNQDKTYDVVLTLGIKTDSGDITGKVLQREDYSSLEINQIQNAIYKFKGIHMQIPPMVSAKKYKGQPLYKYARQGKTIPRTPKQIHIYDIELSKIAPPHISFTVHCSKGTYIRTLCEDIGNILNTSACASEIHRIKSGHFTIEQATSLDEFLELDLMQINNKVISLQDILTCNYC